MNSNDQFYLYPYRPHDYANFMSGLELFKLIGMPWTPERRLLELVLDGKFLGLYILSETVNIDKNRINISEWIKTDSEGNPLDKWEEGGSLINLNGISDVDSQIRFYDSHGTCWDLDYGESVEFGHEPNGYLEWLLK